MSERRRFALRTLLVFVLLELIAAAQAGRDDGSSALTEWARAAVSPLSWTASWASRNATDLYHGVRDLQCVLADLQQAREAAQSLEAENSLLREDLAALREASGVLPLLAQDSGPRLLARCNFRNLAQGVMQLHLAGDVPVHRNTVAVSGRGLVGRVTTAGRRRGWLQLITHPAAAVAVRTTDRGVFGLVTGSGPGELEVEYVPRTADLVRGAILESSGADGIYPPGIPVARVTAVRETDAAFLEVAATPIVDLGAVRVVQLLPEWSLARSPEKSD